MSRSESATGEGDVEKTLAAIQEFARYLQDMEEGISRESKKLRNKETAQSAGLAAAGIHEALNYLTIVKKVIQKTQRVLRKRELDHPMTTAAPGPISANVTDLDQ